MSKVPKLFDLCVAAISDELLQGDENNEIVSVIPSELLHRFLPHLPPLALQKIQENLPFDLMDGFEHASDDYSDCRKRRRCGMIDIAWQALYIIRWPRYGQQNGVDTWLNKPEAKHEPMVDWQQMYWEAHLQDCIDAVAETALLPSYEGGIGEIHIPDALLEIIGCRGHLVKLTCNCIKFSYHCQQFGIYARYLRLPNVLCVAETCHLLQGSKLRSLEFQWIKSNEHVEGLCQLLNQHNESLKAIEFIHCKLSPSFIDAICDSLYLKDLKTHGIEHFSIKRSSFLQIYKSHVPARLVPFLRSGRLCSLTFSDDQLGIPYASTIFDSLNASTISSLDLSENNISGFLIQFGRIPITCRTLSLQSLRLLNLRCCNLIKDDMECLRQALVCAPNLEKLDLSDNSIGDGISYLIPYFTEVFPRDQPFIDLKLENCELNCNHIVRLLGVLSTMKTPLNVLSLKGNTLGRKIGPPLGKFICNGVRALDIEDIGLGPSGFKEMSQEISTESKILYINISNNQGGLEAAKFVGKIISDVHEIVAIDARYNSMPMESLLLLSSALKALKGNLQHLDLSGNSFFHVPDAAGILSDFKTNGPSGLNLLFAAAQSAPHDDDP